MSGGGYALPGLQIHLALMPGANQNVGWRLRLTRPTNTSRSDARSQSKCRVAATPYPAYKYISLCCPEPIKMSGGGCALPGLQRHLAFVGPVSAAPPGSFYAALTRTPINTITIALTSNNPLPAKTPLAPLRSNIAPPPAAPAPMAN
ncbi:hypothetical protein D3C73_71930 [compost metagenome]